MLDKIMNKEVENYYEQLFKIACPNLDYDAVMQFLRFTDYNSYGFFLKDLDITMDYAETETNTNFLTYTYTLLHNKKQPHIHPINNKHTHTHINTHT